MSLGRKTKRKLLHVYGVTEDSQHHARQLLIKFDTYGVPYWVTRDLQFTDENEIFSGTKDVYQELEDCRVVEDPTFGTLYFFGDYMAVKGNYTGRYVIDTFIQVYKKYQGIREREN